LGTQYCAQGSSVACVFPEHRCGDTRYDDLLGSDVGGGACRFDAGSLLALPPRCAVGLGEQKVGAALPATKLGDEFLSLIT
jgi:hypothetical protein